MKKYLFLAAALTVMGCGMTSCSNDAEDIIEQNEQAPKVTKLVFTVANDAETRATWGGTNGRTPMFEEGETVSLFSDNNDNVKLTAHVSGYVVTLEGEGVADDNLYFVYPYYEYAQMNDGKISTDHYWNPYYINGDSECIVENSTIGVNKYPANALSLAKSTDGGKTYITFKGLMAILKYTPKETRFGNIQIPGMEGGNLLTCCAPCGKVTIDVAQGKISTQITNGSDICVPQNYQETDLGYQFEEGKSYYIAFPPFTTPANTSGKLCLKPQNGGSDVELWNGSITFEAGKIYSVNK